MSNINKNNKSNYDYLRQSIELEDEEGVAFYITKTKDINRINKRKENLLFYALRKTNSKIVNLLLQHKANPNVQNIEGMTPLIDIIETNSYNVNYIVRQLLLYGANPNLYMITKDTPLMCACNIGNMDVVNTLLNFNADIDIQNNKGWTALTMTAYQGYESIVDLLLKNKANPNIKTQFGFSPLMYACNNGDLDMVKNLVEHGAIIKNNPNDKDDCLSIAENEKHYDIVSYLKGYITQTKLKNNITNYNGKQTNYRAKKLI